MKKIGAFTVLGISLALGISLGAVSFAQAQQSPAQPGAASKAAPPAAAQPGPGAAAANPAQPTAQTPPTTPAEESEINALVPGITVDLAKAAINGSPADMETVGAYLSGGAPDSHSILIRSLALVRAVGATPAGADEQVLLGVGLRLAQAAQKYIESHSIIRVTVDRTYRPTTNAKAYKFAAAGTEVPTGFELVALGDKRLDGAAAPFHGPATDALTGNGLTGVHCFTTEAENGKYRVMVLTADLGKPRLEPSPLGQTIMIEGQATKLVNSDPSKWMTWAYLTNRKGETQPAGALKTSMLMPSDGVVTHQAAAGGLRGAPQRPGAGAGTAVPKAPRIPAVDVASTSGGVFAVDSTVTGKQFKLCMDPAQGTVLVGLILEAPAGTALSGGSVNMVKLEGAGEFPTAVSPAKGKPWRAMHRDGYTGTEAEACQLLGLTESQCDQYNKMVAAGSCSVQLMPNGTVLTEMGYTSQATHKNYIERNVLVDLKNPLSREVLLCRLGPGLYVGRAFGCNNPVRIEGADVAKPAAPIIGPNMIVTASAADIGQRIAKEAEGLPFAGGPAPGGPTGDPGVTIPPHPMGASPT